MLPKMWRQRAEHDERLARRAEAQGFRATATEHYDHAVEAYRMAHHPIYYDDNPIKIGTCAKLAEMVDRRSNVAPYPIERVEVPFDDGTTISCLLHLLPDRRREPCVIYVPGMNQTKEAIPKAHDKPAIARGMHILSMDGPGQGNSNMRKIRAVGDAYERAGAAVIDHLLTRPEVDGGRIGLCGVSMGSYWSLRLASHGRRRYPVLAAILAAVHVHGRDRRRGCVRRLGAEHDCHHYILDWMRRALVEGRTGERRIAFVAEDGDGPFGDCEWQPPIGPGEAYF